MYNTEEQDNPKMRIIKYRELEIPMFYPMIYNIGYNVAFEELKSHKKINLSEDSYENTILGLSFDYSKIDALDLSVLENVEGEEIIVDYFGDRFCYYILENLGVTHFSESYHDIPLVYFKYRVNLSKIPKEALDRCIKINKILDNK